MTIPLECACGKLHQVPDEHAGKKIKCSECFQILMVPPAAGSPSLLSREPGGAAPRAIPKTSLEVADALPAPLPMHPRTMLEQPSAEQVPPPPKHPRTMLEQPSGEQVPPPPVHSRTVLVQPTDGGVEEPTPRRREKPSGDYSDRPAAPRRSKMDRAPERDRDDEPAPAPRRHKAESGSKAAMVGILAAVGIVLLGGAGGLIWWVAQKEDAPVATVTPKDKEKQKGKEEEKTKTNSEKGRPKEDPKPVVDPSQDPAVAQEQLYRRLLRSTTWVVREDGASGSGVLIDAKERLVLTSYHVVNGASGPTVYFPDFTGATVVKSAQHYRKDAKLGNAAQILWSDSQRDLAVLQLRDDLAPGMSAVILAAQSVSPGGKILAIGNSGVEEDEMWRGIPGQVKGVSAQSLPVQGKAAKVFMLASNAPTTFGDSGGPVVDARGILVGLVIGANVNGEPMSSLIDIREIRATVDACYRSKYKKDWQDTKPAEVVDVRSLPKLLEKLKSSDNKARGEAAESLGNLGPEARTAVPTLLSVYKQGDPVVNQQVLTALEKIGPPAPTEAGKLTEAIGDAKPEMRLYAIRSLTRMGAEGAKALPGLKKACEDPEAEVRYAALFAVDKVSDEESLEVHPLATARLKDEKVRPRSLAATILQTRGKHARSEVLAPLMAALTDRNAGVVTEVEKALAAIAPMTAEDVPVLQKALANASARVRFFAAYSLQLLEAKALPALAELVKAIEDQDDRVRRAAIGAVGKFGAKGVSGVPRLLATLVHPDKGLRVAAVEALGGIGRQPGVFPALFTALTDREVDVRATAASALERIGKPDKADLEGISKFLTAEQSILRSQAAGALGRLGADAKGSVPDLTRMVREDKSVRARLAAVTALKEIGPDAREASEALAKALGDRISPTEEDLSDLFAMPAPKAVGASDAAVITKGLLRSTVLVGVPQRFGGTVFSSGWVVDTAKRLIVTSSRSLSGTTGLVFVCIPDDDKGEVRNQLRHYQENAKRLALPARVVFADDRRELAVLQLVGRIPAIMLPLRLASTGIAADQTIHAMGAVNVNATLGEGTLWTHTSAKVRQISLRTYFASRGKRAEARFIETDKQLECDDAGGPVVNDQLQLVGMVSGKRDTFSRLPQCMDLGEIKGFLAEFGKVGKIEGGDAPAGPARPASAGVNQAIFRLGCASALEKTGTDVPDKVVPALVVAMGDPSAEVQLAALAAISSLGEKAKKAFPQLIRMLPKTGEESPVEEAIIKMGSAVALDLAKIITFKNFKNEVMAASRMLRKMGKEGAPAIPELKKHMREREQFWKKNPDVIAAMKETLETLEQAK